MLSCWFSNPICSELSWACTFQITSLSWPDFSTIFFSNNDIGLIMFSQRGQKITMDTFWGQQSALIFLHKTNRTKEIKIQTVSTVTQRHHWLVNRSTNIDLPRQIWAYTVNARANKQMHALIVKNTQLMHSSVSNVSLTRVHLQEHSYLLKIACYNGLKEDLLGFIFNVRFIMFPMMLTLCFKCSSPVLTETCMFTAVNVQETSLAQWDNGVTGFITV